MSHAAKLDSIPTGPLTASQADPDRIADALIELMVGLGLNEYERERVLQKLEERNQAIATPRAGNTLGAVVEFFRRERPRAGNAVTIEEIRASLVKNGIQATPKEIYNAVGYLTRKKHIERVGYGEYIIADPREGD